MRVVDRCDQWTEAAKRILPAKVIADIGCGIRPQPFVEPKVWLVIEPHQPYLKRLWAEWSSAAELKPYPMTWQTALDVLPPESVDTAFLLDVVEHLEREEAAVALERTKGLVRQQIVVFTPLGFMPQDPPVDEPDPWGMDGHGWQKHRSGWQPEDFPGWEIILSEDVHYQDWKGRPFPRKWGAFFAIWSRPGP